MPRPCRSDDGFASGDADENNHLAGIGEGSLSLQPQRVSASIVQKGLVHLLILFAMLFAGAVVPAVAHAHGEVTIESAGHFESYVETPMADDASDSDSGQTHDGVAPHHHCSNGMAPIAPMVSHQWSARPLAPFSPAIARLQSRALAPPVEPPLA